MLFLMSRLEKKMNQEKIGIQSLELLRNNK